MDLANPFLPTLLDNPQTFNIIARNPKFPDNCFPFLSHCKLHHLSLGRWTQKRSRSIAMKKWKPWFAAKPLGTWQLFNGSNLVQTWFKHVHLVEVMVNLEIKEPKGNRRNNYKKEKRKTRRKRNDTTKNIFILRGTTYKKQQETVSSSLPFLFLFLYFLSFTFPVSSFRFERFAALTRGAWNKPEPSLLYTPHFTLYTPHFALHTRHTALLTLQSTLYTPHSTLHCLHSTLYTPHPALPSLNNTPQSTMLL